MLLIDAGRLMATQVPYSGELEHPDDLGPREGAPALTRLDHVVNAALLLAYVSQETGDRVGLLAFSDTVSRFVKPMAGRRQFLALTNRRQAAFEGSRRFLQQLPLAYPRDQGALVRPKIVGGKADQRRDEIAEPVTTCRRYPELRDR